jgi:hypothetical protein
MRKLLRRWPSTSPVLAGRASVDTLARQGMRINQSICLVSWKRVGLKARSLIFGSYMTQQATPNPSLATHIFYYVIIVISAIFIALPAMRMLPFSKLVVSLVMLALLATMIGRGMRSGDLNLTLPKIHSQAKAGRRFAPRALELATLIAANLAFWMTI